MTNKTATILMILACIFLTILFYFFFETNKNLEKCMGTISIIDECQKSLEK